MYKPEKLIDVTMEKMYRHSYCLIGNEEVKLMKNIIEIIANHLHYSKYEMKITASELVTRIDLVGKPVYSY